MAINAATLAGLLMVLGVYISYLAMLFVLRRFTYRTWILNAIVLAGMAVALAGLVDGGSPVIGVSALVLGGAWFVVTWRELAIGGSHRLGVGPGDQLPAFSAVTTDGQAVTERDLVAAAPALLVLYRGWWCPSSKAQLDGLVAHYTDLADLGVRIFAGSVDSRAESAPVQEYHRDTITVLCEIEEAFLDAVGVRDSRGAPWYDRLWFGARQRAIAMPATIALGRDGRIVFAQRSTRIDERPYPATLVATLTESGAGTTP